MVRIAIFQSDLKVGGIQKSLINFLNHLDYDQFSVDLFLYEKEIFFESQLNPKVNVRFLSKLPKIAKGLSFTLVSLLFRRPSLGEYDIAIDYNGYWHECAMDALGVNAKRTIMWIHNDVERKAMENWRFRIMWMLYQGKIKKFNQFVAVSIGVKEAFLKKYSGVVPILVIPNRVDFDEIQLRKDEAIDLFVDDSMINIVSAGRLHHQKGFDKLIHYFNSAVKINLNLRLYILGEGDERNKLEKLIESLNLKGRVFLPGSYSNPYAVFNKMDAFVLTSRYEGQGIVLIEAMALGLPVLIEKHLEKYNENIIGVDDMVIAMANCQKIQKIPADMSDYDNMVTERCDQLFLLKK